MADILDPAGPFANDYVHGRHLYRKPWRNWWMLRRWSFIAASALGIPSSQPDIPCQLP
jgi:hypothetical protein